MKNNTIYTDTTTSIIFASDNAVSVPSAQNTEYYTSLKENVIPDSL